MGVSNKRQTDTQTTEGAMCVSSNHSHICAMYAIWPKSYLQNVINLSVTAATTLVYNYWTDSDISIYYEGSWKQQADRQTRISKGPPKNFGETLTHGHLNEVSSAASRLEVVV